VARPHERDARSDPIEVELRLAALAIDLEGALLAHSVRPVGRSSSARRTNAPKMRVSIVSTPLKRRLASRPVSASG